MDTFDTLMLDRILFFGKYYSGAKFLDEMKGIRICIITLFFFLLYLGLIFFKLPNAFYFVKYFRIGIGPA